MIPIFISHWGCRIVVMCRISIDRITILMMDDKTVFGFLKGAYDVR